MDNLPDLMRALVAAARAKPDVPADDVILAALGERADLRSLVLVSYNIYFRRGGAYEAIDLVTEDVYAEFKRRVVKKNREIDFGEVNGKHSEVLCQWGDIGRVVIHGRKQPVELAIALATSKRIREQSAAYIQQALDTAPYDDDSSDSESGSEKRAAPDDAEVPERKRVAADA